VFCWADLAGDPVLRDVFKYILLPFPMVFLFNIFYDYGDIMALKLNLESIKKSYTDIKSILKFFR
jgi:hypothetical protein